MSTEHKLTFFTVRRTSAFFARIWDVTGSFSSVDIATKQLLTSYTWNNCATDTTELKDYLLHEVGTQEHKKCSSIKGSMYKVIKSFICRGCLNPITSKGRTSVDNGASANLEVVDKFCYLGDMMSVDGDADAAVEARTQTEWNKFRQLVPLLTNRDISLIRRGRLYSICVRSSMLHGS